MGEHDPGDSNNSVGVMATKEKNQEARKTRNVRRNRRGSERQRKGGNTTSGKGKTLPNMCM